MNEKMNKWLRWVRKHLLNKYAITLIIAIILLFFVGENSLRKQIAREQQYRVLLQEKAELEEQNRQYREELQRLRNDPANVERYAREHYYMHADNEDVYLIEDK